MKYHAPKMIVSCLCLVLCTTLIPTAFAQSTDNEHQNNERPNVVFDELTVEFSGESLLIDYEVASESWQEVRQFDPQLGVYLPDLPTTADPDFVLHERFSLEQQGQHRIVLTEDLVNVTEVALSLYDEEDQLRAIETPDAIAANLRMIVSPEIISFEAIERPTPQPRSEPTPPTQPPEMRPGHARRYYPYHARPIIPGYIPPPTTDRPDRSDRPVRPSRYDGARDARERRQEFYRQKSEGPSTHDRRTEQLERRIESRQNRSQQNRSEQAE